MFLTATFAVTADVVGDVLGAHLGGRLAGLVSGKLAEGVFAGVRTARLGLLAIEQCRPLPFAAEDRPNLRQLVSQSLGSLLQSSGQQAS
jgi:putative membrane protein